MTQVTGHNLRVYIFLWKILVACNAWLAACSFPTPSTRATTTLIGSGAIPPGVGKTIQHLRQEESIANRNRLLQDVDVL
jgi:hypothetical protein